MTFTMYYTKCENNRVNKTDYITALSGQCQCITRGSIDKLDPVIEIDNSAPGRWGGWNAGCNYIRLDWGDLGTAPATTIKYYFVTKVEIVNNRISIIHLKEDVLYTWVNQINELNAIIVRQENIYSPNLEDPLVPVSIDQTPSTTYFPNGFSKSLEYVLVTSGGYTLEQGG